MLRTKYIYKSDAVAKCPKSNSKDSTPMQTAVCVYLRTHTHTHTHTHMHTHRLSNQPASGWGKAAKLVGQLQRRSSRTDRARLLPHTQIAPIAAQKKLEPKQKHKNSAQCWSEYSEGRAAASTES